MSDPGAHGEERKLGVRLSGRLPLGPVPRSLGAESQGNIRTDGLKWGPGDEGEKGGIHSHLLPWRWSRYPED